MTKQPVVALALLAAAVGVHAASASLTVVGTITPEACAVTLGGGGTVDYGAMSTVTVKSFPVLGTTYRHTTIKTIPLNVSCPSPTAVALAWTDNKASSKVAVNGNDTTVFGLGVSAGANIGSYQINHSELTLAATAAGALTAPAGRLTRTKGSTGAWSVPTTGPVIYFDPRFELGFKLAAADTVPSAIARIDGNLGVEAYFSKALVDSATGAITLDGSATVSLVYI